MSQPLPATAQGGWNAHHIIRRAVALLAVLMVAVLSACSSPPQRPGPHISEPEGQHQLTAEDVNTWLDGKLPDALNRGEIPGAVVTVVHDGQILTTRSYGYAKTGADGEEPRLVDADALFRVGSVSKLPTSIAVMQLVEQGKLNLDADISTYVDVNIQRRFPGDITLRNLLTHTAGFEEHVGIATQDSELESYILQDPPTQIYAPGTTPAYSNYGMSLAGYIVQQVSGERFEDYIRDHVFAPAGMDSSTYEQPLPAHLTDRMANGYQSNGSTAHPFEIMADSPDGAMTTSGADAGRFMLALLGQSQGSPLLQESTWQQMFSPALTTDQLGTLAKGKQMGLGFFDENRNGHQIVGHGGDLSSHFHADLEVYPGDGNGIFIAVNGSGKDMAVALRSDLMRDFSDRYHPGTAPTPGEKPTVDESRQHAQQVAGTYFSARTFLTTFFSVMNALPPGWGTLTSLGNGNLLLGRGGSVTEYEEIAPWVWRAVDGSNTITAQVENGTVVRIGATPAFSMLPVTPAQKAFLPVMVIATAVLVLFLVAWPAGAIRRWQAKRKGETAPSVPLTWPARLARIGAGLTLAAIAAWVVAAMSLMSNATSVAPLALHGIQAVTLLGILGTVPAAIDLVQAIRTHAGIRRIIAASLLLVALGAVTWMVLSFHILNPDVTF